jgi:hypothetical protein
VIRKIGAGSASLFRFLPLKRLAVESRSQISGVKAAIFCFFMLDNAFLDAGKSAVACYRGIKQAARAPRAMWRDHN